ncbi:hypothetical protein HO133_005543 [Letharia lupina]|uniref:Mid2 domain-containing protein n=1 Tax=Letharia lupina TaxID=560253 RepID=A0A8H6C8W0_9LECA|nr:uncharacterized protein HO133_005543 [Letharia lupina]KAF6218999.1 hypothetical protein HO133_005543 [Letharia lupina]
MRAPNRIYSYSRTSRIAKSTALIATLLTRTCAATLPAPPSPADKWLYPDVNTLPTYNYLDTVNASWTSNFVAPYLLLRCQHPNDTAHYAYPYNQSVPATGSALVPLDDGNAWVCHFEVSDLSASSATPPTFISNDFNIVLGVGQRPVLWTNAQSRGETAASSATSNPTAASPSSSRISTSSTTTSSVATTHTPLSSATSTPTTAPTTSSTIASSSATTPTPTQPSTPPTPSSTTSGLSKSKKIAIIVGSTMGALLLLVVAVAVLFILRTRRSERNAVVYRSGPGNGYGSKEVPGLEAPRERWKGLEIPSVQPQGYF